MKSRVYARVAGVRRPLVAEVVSAEPVNLRRAADLLRAGELVCFPTETVYGVAADALNGEAVRRVFRAKGRPADHPVIVHLPSQERMEAWVETVPDAAWALARRFWPGPLTMVLRRAAGVPNDVTGGQDTVALRVPGHPLALRLLEEFGGALVAPSANRFGRISPTRAEHALAELGDEVALILDGGASSVGVESTIIDLSGADPLLLRPGAVSRRQLARVLGVAPLTPAERDGPRAPGRLASHYAPLSPVRMVTDERMSAELATVPEASVLSRRPAPPAVAGLWLRLPADPAGYARELYDALRRLDTLGRPIFIEAPPTAAEWEAVNDRLRRACGSRGPDQ